MRISVSTRKWTKIKEDTEKEVTIHEKNLFFPPPLYVLPPGAVLPEYTRVRAPDDHAIADLAMYNYVEVIFIECVRLNSYFKMHIFMHHCNYWSGVKISITNGLTRLF